MPKEDQRVMSQYVRVCKLAAMYRQVYAIYGTAYVLKTVVDWVHLFQIVGSK